MEQSRKIIKNVFLNKYQTEGFSQVQGWCSEALFFIVDYLDSLEMNKNGGVCEIGVHHGKFYLLLNSVTGMHDKSYAIDVFEDQFLNVDRSGGGSTSEFKKNLTLFDTHQGRNTTIVKADSTDAEAVGSILTEIGRGSIRFMSVDGGHTVQH